MILMTTSHATANENAILDQEFRLLASDDVVNIGEQYDGKVLLVVNTASKCGNTPQYDGLEKLYQEYGDRGLVVLGFPSNDFLGQEPGTEEEIQDFCRLTYKVKFPMFEKITVKEGKAHPFYDRLAAAAGTYPTWNCGIFTSISSAVMDRSSRHSVRAPSPTTSILSPRSSRRWGRSISRTGIIGAHDGSLRKTI
jgi:glutathione peroxidase